MSLKAKVEMELRQAKKGGRDSRIIEREYIRQTGMEPPTSKDDEGSRSRSIMRQNNTNRAKSIAEYRTVDYI